jgi:site-specific DNA recombinase
LPGNPLGATIIKEYPEPGKTATNMRRPKLQQLLAELADLKPTYVIFYDLSRVARDEFDAFWLLREIDSCGAKLESTLEHVDDTSTGMLMYGVMASLNAFRSRRDGEKVKVGVERKFLDGGAHGPARTGYLNARENVGGREVAVIAPDPERSAHIKLCFDLAATGDHTITTITDILDDAGLRTRPTPTRPSHPLSRSMIHRILRDDFYTGIVTRKGVKRQGRHKAIIDRETFDRVQEVLDGHRASGDRSHKHSHYLKGSIYCICGKRLGYGRHRGRHGGVYDYFSCLSRVQRGGRCSAPYFRVEPVERAIEARYKTLSLSPAQQEAIREALHAYVDARAEVARRESSRHARRLRELTGEQQKLVQLYYKGNVSEEVLEAEQTRIEAERTEARRWSAAAVREVKDVMQALNDALSLVDRGRLPYLTANATERRLINQAIFHRLVITSADSAEAEPTPLYSQLAQLARDLAPSAARTGQNKTRRSPQDDHDPNSWGRGSYIEQMAEREGFEPSSEVSPATRFPVAPVQPLRHLSWVRRPGAGGGTSKATTPAPRPLLGSPHAPRHQRSLREDVRSDRHVRGHRRDRERDPGVHRHPDPGRAPPEPGIPRVPPPAGHLSDPLSRSDLPPRRFMEDQAPASTGRAGRTGPGTIPRRARQAATATHSLVLYI